MKFKAFFTLLLVGAMSAAAQSQGYMDGVEYYKAGQYENAKTILTNTLNQSTTDKAQAYYYLGETNLSLGDKAAAKQCFEAGVAADANCPYNYVGIGQLELMAGNTSAANDNFKRAMSLAKKNYEIIVSIARAYYNADPVKYAKEVEKYITKAHKDSKNQEPSLYILEGDMLADQEDFGGAAAKYEMAIGFDNDNPEGYVKYAKSYFRVNPQFSINKLEEFLSVAPQSALGQRELAEAYYEANYWNKAAEQYGRYIQNPNHFPQDKARYCVLLYYGENYAESLKVANEVLAQDPSSFLMQRLRFLNEVQLQQYAEGARDAKTFFESNPNGHFTANDYTTYADALSQVGEDSLALVQYETAAVKYPENTVVLQGLSSIYNKNKNYLRAAEVYDQYIAAQENPDLNDLFVASARWLNVGATAGDDQELRALASKNGLAYVDKVIAEAKPTPFILQRKARLQLAGNNNKPNEAAIATYMEMVDMLNADPANMDAANPDNNLALYNEAYNFALLYYTNIAPDHDKAMQISELLRVVKEKLAN